MITLDREYLGESVTDGALASMMEEVEEAAATLESGTGEGGEFVGWLHLPDIHDSEEYERMKEASARIRSQADCLVVIGIGGSYLGARAALDFLDGDFPVFFAGKDLSPHYLNRLLGEIGDRKVFVNYISKSGGTLEPALAFRVFRQMLEERYGPDWTDWVITTTDGEKGKLRDLTDREGIESFTVPDDVGGRYSVLSPVGLLPLMTAGVDTDRLLQGALKVREDCRQEQSAAKVYAAVRNVLYRQGKSVEILASYDPSLGSLAEWWKQLFGESEGKDGQGIFPASTIFTTDLHSLGQFIQEGSRIFMETVLWIEDDKTDVTIPSYGEDYDGLGYLEEKPLSWVNEMACLGTMAAHLEGGTPNLRILVPKANAYYLGQLFYFFMYVCGLSGYMQKVNPFNQPGVEAYKTNVFNLLKR